ncbi:AAA family ATPase [Bacillus testis]|uniref:AAA family ATPase n=1 Tax=Bacillus testis TaxID=1622072 RepID=UPI00067F262A|nr:AAA family ATPase [Bacillus testis]
MENNLNIFLVSEHEAIHSQLLNAFSDQYKIRLISPDELIREVNRDTPDIVIYIQPESDVSVESIQFLQMATPSTQVIFIARVGDLSLLRNVTQSGATEFFVYPEEISLFISRFSTICTNYKKNVEISKQTLHFSRGRGQIFSFFSSNGGSGKSLLASTFAQTLKLELNAEVILIDLNLQFGGIETMLSIDSTRSIADLLPVADELNESHIRNVCQKLPDSKVDVLLSPCDAEVAESLSDEFIAKLLRTCRRSFDFVVIDLPSYINAQVVTALEEADQIIYILNPNTPSLKTLKQFEELSIRLGIELSSRASILINKVARENEVQEKDLKSILRFPVNGAIRLDHKGVQPFINKGEPIRKVTKERRLIPFAKDVKKWALAVVK